jgi:tRNA pseudouridine38-40 synthase
MRYFIDLSFKGTAYHGWQLQPNARTVQEEIEKALQMLTGSETKTTGAGRTDTGVHARHFIAHFDSDHDLPANSADFLYKMNAILPGDILIHGIRPVGPDSHARYSAVSRTYKYTITTEKDPFTPEFSWFYRFPLDVEKMNLAAEKLRAYSDFTSFSKLHSDVKTNRCQIFEAGWTIEPPKLIFTIKADRFLRNMVRAITGTLTEIGRGKMDINELDAIIEGRDRRLAGFSVPAQGLMLWKIEYPPEINI